MFFMQPVVNASCNIPFTRFSGHTRRLKMAALRASNPYEITSVKCNTLTQAACGGTWMGEFSANLQYDYPSCCIIMSSGAK